MLFGPFEKYVRPYRGRILLGALAIGIGQAAAARIPLLVGDAVDAIPTGDDGAGRTCSEGVNKGKAPRSPGGSAVSRSGPPCL